MSTTRNNRTGVYEIGKEPTLADLFRSALRNNTLRMRTSAPATVTAYNPIDQTVTVTVGFLEVVKILGPGANDLSTTAPTAPIILTSIPVAWPGTQLGYMTFPLTPGDTGQIICTDRALDAWRQNGVPSDPVSSVTHSLTAGVFYPGLHPDTQPITPPTDLSSTVLHGDTLIKLGRSAAQFVALAPLVLAELQAIVTSFNAHTHVAPTSGGQTTVPVPIIPNPGNVGSTKVQAE